MNKQEIITKSIDEIMSSFDETQKNLLSEINKQISDFKIKIINEIKQKLNDNPIDSFNYVSDNNSLNEIPYDYFVLSKYCPTINDIIKDYLLKRITENDEQYKNENKKIFIKLTKKIEKLNNDLKILNKDYDNLINKYTNKQKYVSSSQFKKEINRLRIIKQKYDLLNT
jgi:hypothetical protein